MKKVKTICLFFLTAIFSLSCSKSKINNVHFHGNVTYNCNGQPAANIHIDIEVVYNGAMQGGNIVCNTTTDNNGNYSVIADVSYEGTILQYGLFSDERWS